MLSWWWWRWWIRLWYHQRNTGGVGGQAGVGHNGNGGGTGGKRGISAYRTTYWHGSVSESASGALPTEGGYVKIQFSNVLNIMTT